METKKTATLARLNQILGKGPTSTGDGGRLLFEERADIDDFWTMRRSKSDATRNLLSLSRFENPHMSIVCFLDKPRPGMGC
jgi:hypothetical protein